MSNHTVISSSRYAFGACAVAAACALALLSLAVASSPSTPAGSSMGPPTALGALAAGLSWLASHSRRRSMRAVGLGLAATAGLIAVVSLLDAAFDVELRLQALTPALGPRADPAVATSIALLCAAVALALTRAASDRAEDVRQVARLVGLSIALFALALHFYDPGTLAVISGFETLRRDAALTLALLFLALGFDRSSASLRWQVAHIGVVVVAPLAALTVHFASSEREIALQHAGARLAVIVRLGVEQQDAIIDQARKTLVFLARSADIRRASPFCASQLASYVTLNAWTRSLFVVDRDGNVLCADQPALMNFNLMDRDYVKDAFASQSFTISGFFTSRLNGQPRIAVAQPLQIGGRTELLLGAALDLGALGDPLERLAFEADPGVTMTLVDPAGIVIARYPENRAVVGSSLADATFATIGLASPGATFEAAEIGGAPTVFVSRRLSYGEGTLIVGLPKGTVVAPVDARMNARLALICALLAGSIALGTVGGECLVLRPLRRLTAYAGRLAAGDMAARPDVSARGEVGALGRALGVMAAAVEDRERRMRAAEALFRGLFDHSPDSKVVLRVEPDGAFRIETWNAAAEQATGLAQAVVVGRTPQELFPGARGAAIERDMNRALLLGEVSTFEREASVNGQSTTYEMVQVPLRDADGRIERLFLSARDISERKRVERLKNEFVSTVSHELRTPLTSIAGSLGLLAGGAAGPLGDKAGHLIAIAHSNSLRLVRLINDILDIEKIESGRMVFDLRPVAVGELVDQVVGGLRAYADGFGVTIATPPCPEEAIVRGDVDRLTQVLTNLVSNAIKFSPPDGVVTVAVAVQGEIVSIGVRDRGAGIPESFRPRIFSKFAQADGSDSRRKGGTGLGLAIVKEIVERHAGAVTYATARGEGAEFIVRLPRYAAGRAAATPFASEAKGRPKILICEDDPFIAAILAEQMLDAGFDSLTVGTVRSALAAAASEQIDAVLVDLNLPDGDGISLIRDLRASVKTAQVPIVVVSAAASQGRSDARAAMLDVVAWLEKPIDAQRLAAILTRRLGKGGGRPRILHVEDDPDLCKVVSAAVAPIADVISVGSVRAARAEISSRPFDLAIIDVGLEDGSGLDLLLALERNATNPIPTVIFSAHDIDREVAAQVEGAITKSRSSLGVLVDTVQRLVASQTSDAA